MPATAARARRPRYVPVVVTADELARHRLRFDAATCGRCQGRGRLEAFSGVLGGVCFGCGGSGEQLTREGKAARKRYDAALDAELRVRYDEIAVGDLVQVHHGDHRARWATVDGVEARDGYAGSSLLGAGLEGRELTEGLAYYTPLPGHRNHNPEYVHRDGTPMAWVDYYGSTTISTAAGSRPGERATSNTGPGSTRIRRYSAEGMAAAWTAALSKRGAEIVAA